MYMKNSHKYRLHLIPVDMLALVMSGIVGLYLRFEATPDLLYIRAWGEYMLTGVPTYWAVYYYFGLYSRIWYHASARDLAMVIVAVTIATMLLFGIMYASPWSFPRSVILMSWFFNLAAVGGIRFAVHLIVKHTREPRRIGSKHTLILGAGDAGRMLVEEVSKHGELDCRIVGFLDDDKQKHCCLVAGLPVLGSLSLLEEVVAQKNITEIIIAMPSAPSSRIKELVKRCLALGLKPKTVPGLYEILRGGLQVSAIRNVQIEDLLPRPVITKDLQSITSYLKGQTVLITGAGGSVGSELSRQVATAEAGELLLLGHGENSIYQVHRELTRLFPAQKIVPLIADIQDKNRIEFIFNTYRPHVVFHAAAHKHVPLIELNPIEALKNNVLGTLNVAQAAKDSGVKIFVLISTDKAVNPTSVMGASKSLAELIVQGINQRSATDFVAVRFGNVLGSRGSAILVFQEQIARGGPITITHPEMTRYFMTIPEAVSLVIEAGSMATGGEIFVLDMGEPLKIADLARDLITLSGLRPVLDIDIEYVGIRSGEKLHEELATREEGLRQTKHEKIFTVSQRPLQAGQMADIVRTVEMLIRSQATPQTILSTTARINAMVGLNRTELLEGVQ
jgi:FlaA1/EpsC-like NDP-sugar epimerase